jgi:hypothetical protein
VRNERNFGDTRTRSIRTVGWASSPVRLPRLLPQKTFTSVATRLPNHPARIVAASIFTPELFSAPERRRGSTRSNGNPR